jgi:hypothetical protein
MTLGHMVTLSAAATGLITALHHWMLLRKLPTRSEAAYDDTVASPALAYKVVIVVGLALPVVAYALFRLVDPELFRMEVF